MTLLLTTKILIALFAITGFIVSTIKWRVAIVLFYLWLIAEGAVRKWFLPGLAKPLFFMKYIILVGPYFCLLAGRIKVTRKDYPFLGLLFLYLLWGVLEVFNIRANKNLLVGVLGLMVHFWFVPLVFIIPRFLPDKRKVNSTLFAIAVLSIPVFILGVVQYFFPPTSFINQYADKSMAVAKVGRYARITSTFSYISTYNAFLNLSLLSCFYLLLARSTSTKTKIIVLPIMGLGLLNLIMTGSRGPVIIVFAIFATALITEFKPAPKDVLRYFIALLAFLLLTIFVLQTSSGRKATNALYKRFIASQDIEQRLERNFSPARNLFKAGFTGFGIGTTYQGSRAIESKWSDMPRYFESEIQRIILELGAIGFLILTLLRLSFIVFALKTYIRQRDGDLKLIAILVMMSLVIAALGFRMVIFNYIDNAIYWSSIGLLVAIHQMDHQEKYNETSLQF